MLTPTEPLAWGNAVKAEFRDRVYRLCDELGWGEDHASWLMACMAFETGRTFSPSIRNPGSSAVGLIQIMGATAKYLGTSNNDLAHMSAVAQLHYVQRYLAPMAARINSLEDMYMAILWPAAIGKSNATKLWGKGSSVYYANRGLDLDKDGRITKGEAAGKVRGILAEGLNPPLVWVPEHA